MNNLAKILEKIDADGQMRIEKLRADTAEKAARMETETDATITSMEKDMNAALEKDIRELQSRARASSAMLQREIPLREKASLLREAYERAEAAILSLPIAEYTAFVASLAATAVIERNQTVRFLQTEYADAEFADVEEVYTLHFSEKDRERIGTEVLASVQKQVQAVLSKENVNPMPTITLGADAVSISGGVVVRYGDTETTCALPVLLAGLHDKLDVAVLQTLLGT